MSSDRNIAINQPFVLIAAIDNKNDMLNDINEITIKKCISVNNNIYKLSYKSRKIILFSTLSISK